MYLSIYWLLKVLPLFLLSYTDSHQQEGPQQESRPAQGFLGFCKVPPVNFDHNRCYINKDELNWQIIQFDCQKKRRFL